MKWNYRVEVGRETVPSPMSRMRSFGEKGIGGFWEACGRLVEVLSLRLLAVSIGAGLEGFPEG